jgi:hypothetical protein
VAIILRLLIENAPDLKFPRIFSVQILGVDVKLSQINRPKNSKYNKRMLGSFLEFKIEGKLNLRDSSENSVLNLLFDVSFMDHGSQERQVLCKSTVWTYLININANQC